METAQKSQTKEKQESWVVEKKVIKCILGT
jgi:hypothetical protein